MVNLTISTDGVDARIGSEPKECHTGEIDYTRHYGDRAAQAVRVVLNERDAFGVAVDLLYQLVDAGVIAGWNVQFPEVRHAAA